MNPKFFNPRGRSTYGIGVCARCNIVHSLDDLVEDPNYPGLRVCAKDADEYDPYRLPPREPDQVNLLFTRPDVPLDVNTTPPVKPGDPGWLPEDSTLFPGM